MEEIQRKSIRDISWNVTEEEYRADPAISYSTLSRFEREGWRNIGNLFTRIETSSLTFGSAVDCLLTDGEDAFRERFFVADFPNIPDSIIRIVKVLFDSNQEQHRNLDFIPDREVIQCASMFDYQNNWKPETRAKVIKEKGEEYYSLLYLTNGRVLLSTDEYHDVLQCVEELRTNNRTESYFSDSPFDEDVEKVFQLKFKAEYEGQEVRCMFDELIVDHANKEIYLIDLKTTGHPEEEFEKSFVAWRYDIQAKLYTYILRENLKRDPYFRSFHINNYEFITINRKTLAPIVWQFDLNFSQVDLQDENGKVLRDWRKILEDLVYYFNHPSTKYSREVMQNEFSASKIRNLKPIYDRA